MTNDPASDATARIERDRGVPPPQPPSVSNNPSRHQPVPPRTPRHRLAPPRPAPYQQAPYQPVPYQPPPEHSAGVAGAVGGAAASVVSLYRRGTRNIREKLDDRSAESTKGVGHKVVGQSMRAAKLAGGQAKILGGKARALGQEAQGRWTPVGGGAGRAHGQRPVAITIAVGLLLFAGVSVAGQVAFAGRWALGVAAEANSEDTGGNEWLGLVGDVAHGMQIALAACGVVVAVCYVSFAISVLRGHSWPRSVGIVLAVISLPMLLFGVLAQLAVLCGIGVVILLWLPVSRQFAGEVAGRVAPQIGQRRDAPRGTPLRYPAARPRNDPPSAKFDPRARH